jgi:hypothetical protein
MVRGTRRQIGAIVLIAAIAGGALIVVPRFLGGSKSVANARFRRSGPEAVAGAPQAEVPVRGGSSEEGTLGHAVDADGARRDRPQDRVACSVGW